MEDTIEVIVASEKHLSYVETILDTIEKAAKVRGTGIAKRSPEYVKQKMLEGKAIIALDGDKFAGFCYIESWRGISRTRTGQTDQKKSIRTFPISFSGCKNFRTYNRTGSNENQLRIRISSGNILRTYR